MTCTVHQDYLALLQLRIKVAKAELAQAKEVRAVLEKSGHQKTPVPQYSGVEHSQ